MPDKFHYHKFLAVVANEDIQYVKVRDRQYGASWKASGGRSAWFNLARKIDRLKELMKTPNPPGHFNRINVIDTIDALSNNLSVPGSAQATAEMIQHLLDCYDAEDVFQKIEADMSGQDGTVLAEIRDLRRYLLLVEAEIASRRERPIDNTGDYIIEDTSLHGLQSQKD